MTQSDIVDRLDELEAQLDDQQETIEHQQERIDQQAETIERQQERLEEQDAIIRDQRERLDEEATPASESDPAEQEPAEPEAADENTESPGPIATRRGVLTAGSVLGLLGLGAGTASADASGQIGTSSDPLKQLYTTELSTGSNGLTVNTDGDRALDLGTVTQTTIQGKVGDFDVDGGGNVVAGHPLNSVTDAVGTVIGGGGAEPTKKGDFSHTVSGDFGTIGGGINNDVSKLAATVGGGGQNTAKGGRYATVGGGYRNTASGESTTVGGGQINDALARSATVSGGYGNEAIDSETTVSGGASNTAGSSTDSANHATVGGGRGNTASANYATVPGGRLNTADGDYSFAAGYYAKANSKSGAFVWGDSSTTTVTAGATDEVRFQATGGFVIAPESDSTTMLDVQDSGGNSLLAADTSNHKVQVFDGDATDSVDVSHSGTNGSISTSTGDLQLSPSGNVDVQSGIIENTTGDLTLDANGSVSVTSSALTRKTRTVSNTGTTLNSEDYFVEGDTSGSTVDLILPPYPETGEEHVIKRSGGNALNILGGKDGQGNNILIDGHTQIPLNYDNESRKVIWGGSEWHIIGKYRPPVS